MGETDKARNTAQKAKGKVEEGVGRATGDPARERKGRRDQRSADLKQAGEKVKDAFDRR